MFEHLKDENEIHDMQVYDTATEEQQKQQEAVNYPTETGNNDEPENMDEDWELPPGDNRIADGKVATLNQKANIFFAITLY